MAEYEYEKTGIANENLSRMVAISEECRIFGLFGVGMLEIASYRFSHWERRVVYRNNSLIPPEKN